MSPSYYELLDRHKVPIKYLISGSTAAMVDLGALYVLTDFFKMHYLLSASLAFMAAFFVSFYLQKFWTFRDNDRERIYGQIFLYFIVGATNLAVNAGGMYLLVDKLGVMYMLAQVIIGAIIALSSFLIYRYIIFRKHKKKLAMEEAGRKLKVLIAAGIFPPDIGGPATYAKSLSEELFKLNCEVKIITYADDSISNFQFLISKQFSNPNFQIPIYCVGRNQNIIFRYVKYFWRIFKLSKNVDIVYILDLMSAGAPAVLAAKLRGKKVVFRTGGDFLWEKAYQAGWTDLPLRRYYENKKNLREKFLLKFCGRLIKKIDMIIFSTKLQAGIYAKYYNVPEYKIKFVQNPVPELRAGERNEKYKDSIVYAGRLIKLKNLERLIKTFSRLQNQDVKLLICGEGPEKNNLRNLINELKLNDRVSLAGNVDHEKLLSIINSCKFLVLPSITEISPNLALECLSLRKPILLTSETGLPKEIINNLITFNPLSEDDIREKIEFLLNRENLLQYEDRLRRMEIKEWTWEDAAREHVKIFKSAKFLK